MVIVELQHVKRAREALWVRKIGNPSRNLVMTSRYERPSPVRLLGRWRDIPMSPVISGALIDTFHISLEVTFTFKFGKIRTS